MFVRSLLILVLASLGVLLVSAGIAPGSPVRISAGHQIDATGPAGVLLTALLLLGIATLASLRLPRSGPPTIAVLAETLGARSLSPRSRADRSSCPT
jgi:hypothetical protein